MRAEAATVAAFWLVLKTGNEASSSFSFFRWCIRGPLCAKTALVNFGWLPSLFRVRLFVRACVCSPSDLPIAFAGPLRSQKERNDERMRERERERERESIECARLKAGLRS